MRAVLGRTAAVVLALCAGSGAEDKKADPIDATKLVGKWKIKEMKGDNALTHEFTKDGKLVVTSKLPTGEVDTFEGVYEVKGNKLVVMMTLDGKEVKKTLTISKLTEGELVSSDDKGMELTLVRVKGK